ncbi:MAG TPA: phytanoyl-CoA dioxygenase family protein [Rhodothermales bacterium]|nr:phytanoyl-CoA dioxygenase family protein [Rhodothermales bacterium]
MPIITEAHRKQFEQDGYVVVRGLFSAEEAESYKQHFMDLRAAGTYPGDMAGVDLTSDDPLKRYPRMIHMHRWDQRSFQWMLDERLREVLTSLMDDEPLAVQTMLYFKPPGARGQALHQDQHFLRVQPGTCMAAWMALDACDEANGCMRVVPGSHLLPLLCTEQADTSQSFTDVAVQMKDGQESMPVDMQPGDVLFFNGLAIHGSFPNGTEHRFRRSLIGHYIGASAEKVADYYHPVLRMDGTEVTLAASEEGGPCGIWVERDGTPVIEMQPAGVVA